MNDREASSEDRAASTCTDKQTGVICKDGIHYTTSTTHANIAGVVQPGLKRDQQIDRSTEGNNIPSRGSDVDRPYDWRR